MTIAERLREIARKMRAALIDGPAHELRMARLRAGLEDPTPLDWSGSTEGEKS